LTAPETVTVHQLLGRIVYFHTVFIEPSLSGSLYGRSVQPCCRHSQSDPVGDRRIASFRDTAWAVLAEIAATIPSAQCPGDKSQCCPVCQVSTAGQAIAACWIDTEHAAYARLSKQLERRNAWSLAIASRLATTFSRQHNLRCLAERTAPTDAPSVPADQLPLTAELLALWADPADSTPVTSWLNHCANLTDIAHVLNTRRITR
jgi:hypothetical protein